MEFKFQDYTLTLNSLCLSRGYCISLKLLFINGVSYYGLMGHFSAQEQLGNNEVQFLPILYKSREKRTSQDGQDG